MKTDNKYSIFHKQNNENIYTEYIPRDVCPRKRLIKFPEWLDDAMIKEIGIGNISRYLKDLAIDDMLKRGIRRPQKELPRMTLDDLDIKKYRKINCH